MIPALNAAVEAVETHLASDPSTAVDVADLARGLGTTEYHLRRMSLAAAHLLTCTDDLLTVAVRHGYGSTEAFTRAFAGVHGPRPVDVRRVPLVHDGVNPAIAEHVAAVPVEQTVRLKTRNDTEPSGVLAVSADLDPDRAQGTELTYLHGVATTGRPEGLDTIDVPAGTWAVFRTQGPHPAALQQAWADTATEWFPSHPWRLRPGPEIVATLAFDPDTATATCELWLPVEPDEV